MVQKSLRSLITIILTFLIFFALLKSLNSVVDTVNSSNPLSLAERSQLTMKIDDYKVYNLSDIDFRFVVANVTFNNDEESVNVDFQNFVTEDGVKLSEVKAWTDILIARGYDFERFSTMPTLESNAKSVKSELFIPINKLNSSNILLRSDYPLINNINFNLSNEIKELLKTIDPENQYKPMSMGYVFAKTARKETLYRVQRADKQKLQQLNAQGQWQSVQLNPEDRVVVLGIQAPQDKTIMYSKSYIRLTAFDDEIYHALDGSYRLLDAENIFNPENNKKEGFLIFVLPFDNAYERITQGYRVSLTD